MYTLICTTISLQEIIFWPVCWWRYPNLKIQTNIFYSHHRTISPKVTITLLHYHNGSSWTRNNHPAVWRIRILHAVWRIRIKTFKNCVPQPKYGCLQAKISTYSLQILCEGRSVIFIITLFFIIILLKHFFLKTFFKMDFFS